MVRARLRLLTALACLPFTVIAARLIHLQAVQEEFYREISLDRFRSIRVIPPARGRILARDGTVLAGDQRTFDLAYTLDEFHPRERYLTELQQALGLCSEDPPPEPERICSCRILEDHIFGVIGGPLDIERRELLRSADEGARPDDLIRVVEKIPALAVNRYSRKFHRTLATLGMHLKRVRDGYELWILPADFARLELALLRLQRLCGIPYEELRAAAAAAEKEVRGGKNLSERNLLREKQRVLARDVGRDVITEVLYHPERYPGIRILDRHRRSYPLGESSGILTGYMISMSEPRILDLKRDGLLLDDLQHDLDLFFDAFKDLRQVGRFAAEEIGARGLEAAYDDRLRGRHGLSMEVIDAFNRQRPLRPAIEPSRGADLETSIDPELQRIVFEELANQCARLGRARAGSAAVMALTAGAGARDGIPGAILAMACYPSFDPNRIRDPEYHRGLLRDAEVHGSAPFLNRPRAAKLPPGSIFKLIAAAAALEDGVEYLDGRPVDRPLAPGEAFACRYVFDESTPNQYRCNSTNGHGVPGGSIDLEQALKFSCNSYFYHLGENRLRPEILWAWATNFGFGRNPGVDLDRPVDDQDGFPGGDLARRAPRRHMRSYAIGQTHVAASPLQVLRAVAGIALDGRMLPRPYVARPRLPENVGIRRPGTMAAIREGMRRAAGEPGGTAAREDLGLSRYRIAVKTGTAEVATGRDEHHAWIAGFAPLDQPEIAFVVSLENTPLHGGEAGAPILERILAHLARENPARYLLHPGEERPREAPREASSPADAAPEPEAISEPGG